MVMNRLAGEVSPERVVEMLEAGAQPLQDLIAALHTKLMVAELERHRAVGADGADSLLACDRRWSPGRRRESAGRLRCGSTRRVACVRRGAPRGRRRDAARGGLGAARAGDPRRHRCGPDRRRRRAPHAEARRRRPRRARQQRRGRHPGPLETMPIEDFRRQIEVNLTGQVAVTQAMLPLIRKARGRIVFISSIGGRIAFPFAGAYHASKFGIEAVADCFRQELRPWGIDGLAIEPGSIDTPIWERGEADGGRDRRPRPTPRRRRSTARRSRAFARRCSGPRSGASRPTRSPETIEHALSARRPRTRYVVGADARGQALLRSRSSRSPVLDWVVARLMGTSEHRNDRRRLLYWLRSRLTGQSVDGRTRGSLARSRRTAQLDRREGPQPGGRRAPRPRRGRRRRRPRRPAGEVEPARRRRGAAGRRRAARRPDPDRRPRLGTRAGHPSARRQHLRARRPRRPSTPRS